MRKRRLDRRIFFPWEGTSPWRRALALGRVGPFVGAAVVVVAVMWIGVRERRASGIRQTRAALIDVRRAVDQYLAEHDGSCPASLSAVAPYLRSSLARGEPDDTRAAAVDPEESVLLDAWGRPFRVVCPSERPGYDYELMSDGPDGVPGGLDRIE